MQKDHCWNNRALAACKRLEFLCFYLVFILLLSYFILLLAFSKYALRMHIVCKPLDPAPFFCCSPWLFTRFKDSRMLLMEWSQKPLGNEQTEKSVSVSVVGRQNKGCGLASLIQMLAVWHIVFIEPTKLYLLLLTAIQLHILKLLAMHWNTMDWNMTICKLNRVWVTFSSKWSKNIYL